MHSHYSRHAVAAAPPTPSVAFRGEEPVAMSQLTASTGGSSLATTTRRRRRTTRRPGLFLQRPVVSNPYASRRHPIQPPPQQQAPMPQRQQQLLQPPPPQQQQPPPISHNRGRTVGQGIMNSYNPTRRHLNAPPGTPRMATTRPAWGTPASHVHALSSQQQQSSRGASFPPSTRASTHSTLHTRPPMSQGGSVASSSYRARTPVAYNHQEPSHRPPSSQASTATSSLLQQQRASTPVRYNHQQSLYCPPSSQASTAASSLSQQQPHSSYRARSQASTSSHILAPPPTQTSSRQMAEMLRSLRASILETVDKKLATQRQQQHESQEKLTQRLSTVQKEWQQQQKDSQQEWNREMQQQRKDSQQDLRREFRKDVSAATTKLEKAAQDKLTQFRAVVDGAHRLLRETAGQVTEQAVKRLETSKTGILRSMQTYMTNWWHKKQDSITLATPSTAMTTQRLFEATPQPRSSSGTEMSRRETPQERQRRRSSLTKSSTCSVETTTSPAPEGKKRLTSTSFSSRTTKLTSRFKTAQDDKSPPRPVSRESRKTLAQFFAGGANRKTCTPSAQNAKKKKSKKQTITIIDSDKSSNEKKANIFDFDSDSSVDSLASIIARSRYRSKSTGKKTTTTAKKKSSKTASVTTKKSASSCSRQVVSKKRKALSPLHHSSNKKNKAARLSAASPARQRHSKSKVASLTTRRIPSVPATSSQQLSLSKVAPPKRAKVTPFRTDDDGTPASSNKRQATFSCTQRRLRRRRTTLGQTTDDEFSFLTQCE